MAEELGSQAAGLLIDEAWNAHRAGRYEQAVAAASRAAQAAGPLDDPVLLVRALRVEGEALRQMGDPAAALARYTRILGLAEDRGTSGRLDDGRAAEAVAVAHWNWVACARFLTGIPVRELFAVLDAGERWLAATGHRDWRAALLLQRAIVHERLGEQEAAVGAAEEALAVALQHPDAPGYTLGSFRYQLGTLLRAAGQAAEAVPHYQAILADAASGLWDRNAAHEGLAWCHLEANDLVAARREATAAVRLAESLGDDALCTSLDVLADACRAAGDLDAAGQAAARHLEAAGRVGGHDRPYFAVRTAVDIALDRADLGTARDLLTELDRHAAPLDAAAGNTVMADEVARRHERLAELTAASSPPNVGGRD